MPLERDLIFHFTETTVLSALIQRARSFFNFIIKTILSLGLPGFDSPSMKPFNFSSVLALVWLSGLGMFSLLNDMLILCVDFSG